MPIVASIDDEMAVSVEQHTRATRTYRPVSKHQDDTIPGGACQVFKGSWILTMYLIHCGLLRLLFSSGGQSTGRPVCSDFSGLFQHTVTQLLWLDHLDQCTRSKHGSHLRNVHLEVSGPTLSVPSL
jgi:hypothetical protein